ncbi:MAG: hypothetical protein ACRECX_03455 [Methyloceanibacter sp.]|uniref:hypothetical protein n=1 Tax=Methyloceanibacter sp. TaxID=1965321 RepID=UPI003D6D8E88
MKHAALVVALVLLGAGLAGTASAEDAPAQGAAPAASEAEAAKNLEALESMRKARLKVWDEGPLLFRRALFVADSPGGFGIYNARPDTVFKPGEKLVIYAEPVGFKWQNKDGLEHALLVADLVLRAEDGNVVASQESFGEFRFDSHEQNMEVMAVLTIDFTGAPPGKYVVECTFRDQMGDKSAKFALPFEIK